MLQSKGEGNKLLLLEIHAVHLHYPIMLAAVYTLVAVAVQFCVLQPLQLSHHRRDQILQWNVVACSISWLSQLHLVHHAWLCPSFVGLGTQFQLHCTTDD